MNKASEIFTAGSFEFCVLFSVAYKYSIKGLKRWQAIALFFVSRFAFSAGLYAYIQNIIIMHIVIQYLL